MNKTRIEKGGALVEIYDYGAHLTRWRSGSGYDWIFTSSKTPMQPPAAIRGGVPIIFPQFNEFGEGQRHGFARNKYWQLTSNQNGEIQYELQTDAQTADLWPFSFKAQYRVTLEDRRLTLALTVLNCGDKEFHFTAALHSYFRLEYLRQTEVLGLQGKNYWDNNKQPFQQRNTFSDHSLKFEDAIDRVYFDIAAPLVLQTGKHTLELEHSAFQDCVIWNPGHEAAAQMADFGDEEYQNMLCIEAAQIDHPIHLAPGESWTGAQILRDLSP